MQAKISLTHDEHKALLSMADQDLRTPEQVLRWAFRKEALERGLLTSGQRLPEVINANTHANDRQALTVGVAA